MHAVLQGDPHSTAQHVRMASIVASCTSHDGACAGLTAREGRCSGCRLAWIHRQALAVCCGAVARPEREGCVSHMHAPRRRQCGMPDLHVAMVTGHHCRRRSEGRSQQGSAGIHRSMRMFHCMRQDPCGTGSRRRRTCAGRVRSLSRSHCKWAPQFCRQAAWIDILLPRGWRHSALVCQSIEK